LVAVLSEFLVGSIESVTEQIGKLLVTRYD
jgi:hypothetical protein